MATTPKNYLVTDPTSLTGSKSWRTFGVVSILCVMVAGILSFLGGNASALYSTIGVTAVTVIILTILYFIPFLAENTILSPIADLTFIAFISYMATNLRSESDFVIIFLIFALAISAFSREIWAYIIAFLATAVSLLATYSIMGSAAGYTLNVIIIQVIALVSFGILFRVLSAETNKLRKKEILASEKSKQLLDQRRDIYLMIDNISEGIIAVDEERKITLLNRSVSEILGLDKSLSHYIGKNIDDVFVATSDKGRPSVVEVSLSEDQSEIRDDLRIVRHDKTTRLHTESRPIIDEHKHPVGAIVVFKDITAESELEEQRAEFLAIASHELRTPLTVIEGYLYYLTSDKSLKYDTKTSEYLKKTYTAAEDLIHLSNDILAVTRSDEGHMLVNLERVAVAKIIRESEAKFRTSAKSHGIKLVVDLPADLPELVTDMQKVSEVVLNLIENAIKFTTKGSITVKAEVHNQREILVSVTDTGIGISESDQHSIFNKFYRTEDWQTRKTGGSGLGLYIAKNYITRLGGRIGVNSKKGSGSTFWFSLPLVKTKRHEHNQDVQLQDFISNI